MPNRPPTVQDVARHAEVSSMTVSRVLNGATHVSPELRRRVQRAIEQLGYRRNENARSLRPGQRSGLVGVVITNITNPYYAQVLLGIEDLLDESGRRILVGMSHGDAARERHLVTDFRGRQIEGLVVVPSDSNSPHLKAAALAGTPLVLASRDQYPLEADAVVIEDAEGARAGVCELIKRGHVGVGFLGNDARVSTAQRRFEGYARALAEAGLPTPMQWISRECTDIDSTRESLTRLLTTDPLPDALFCTNNQVTVGALDVVMADPRTAGIEILGMDDFPLSHHIAHPLTVIDHDARALGRTAASLLVRRLDGDRTTPPLRVTLPTTVRPRNPA